MPILQINWKFDLIQQMRLVHALLESKFGIALRLDEEEKFAAIKKKIDIQFQNTGDHCIDISSHLVIAHREPRTSIARIERPLIFPHAIAEYCRSLWGDRREHRYGFWGLVTEPRRRLLDTWAKMVLIDMTMAPVLRVPMEKRTI